MRKNTHVGRSISVLICSMIAILAFVRGPLEVPLLLTVFAVWALWMILPPLISARMHRYKDEQTQKAQAELLEAGMPNMETAQILLRHVNHRISAQLKSVYPEIQWEWREQNPVLLALRGGIGRIRIYGAPDFDFADVELDQNANLKCAFIKTLSDSPAESSQPPLNPQMWYEKQGREVMDALIADLSSRGFNSLRLKEDGALCTILDDGEEIAEGRLHSFLPKVYWPQLIKILHRNGLTASIQTDCILVSW